MRRFHSAALSTALLASLAFAAGSAHGQTTKRLSQWLLEQPAQLDAYPFGLSWRVPGEEPAQLALKHELLETLGKQPQWRRLQEWVRSLPVTGRVPVASVDSRWLHVHPDRDPVLVPGHTVAVPRRPRTVTVVSEDGERCSVVQSSGREALEYVRACARRFDAQSADWIWVAQPDGRIARFGSGLWNLEAQDEPAPGAWIWAPARGSAVDDPVSDMLVRWLATQGPAPDPDTPPLELPPNRRWLFSTRARDAALSTNNWGETGLLQTPSARIKPAGNVTFHLSHAWPYTRMNFFVQPFDWMEAGFRYSDVANRLYTEIPTPGFTQSFKDKSFDLKLRLWPESAYAPQVAIGIRDIAGTGLFSGEYAVANKRFGPLDFSLGMGWGYLGARGDVENPLASLDRRFESRQREGDQGGNFAFNTYFRGPASWFGGVQYQTPWDRWLLKLEREGNDYQREPLGNPLPQRSPWNAALIYQLTSWADFTFGVERGNRLTLSLALHGRLSEAYMPKVADPPRVPYVAEPVGTQDWSAATAEIAQQTGWRVGRVEQTGRDLRVTVVEHGGLYRLERVERAIPVLHRDAPNSIERFVVVYRQAGTDMAEQVIDRATWAREQTQPVPPHERLATIMERPPVPTAHGEVVFEERQRFQHGLGLDLQYRGLGGPDAFVFYDLGIAERARFWIREDTWIRAKLRLGLVNNYDDFRTSGTSDLPRVRTFAREYATTSQLTMPQLQATHAGKLSESHYYSVYAGYFEDMYGGVGAEWLYRPFASRTAFGVDINRVRQREFDQAFDFRDYEVTTGHASLYLDTGWNDVLATINVGRYLAGDVGVTVQLARGFKNGMWIGAFATKTNVSAQQFGEGSFDKGVFLSIPFDVALVRSSPSIGTFVWKPLTRDGGQMLGRNDTLYALTYSRDGRAFWHASPTKRDAASITRADHAPYLRTPSRPSSEQPAARQEQLIAQALAQQGFGSVTVAYDGSRRLSISLAHEEFMPPERAVGRAARTAVRLAPLHAREVRIKFFDGGEPVAIFEFYDAAVLERFFNGTETKAQLAERTAIYYADATNRPRDPLAWIGDLMTYPRAEALGGSLRGSLPMRILARAAGDADAVTKVAASTDWLPAALVGAGLVAGTSLLDRTFFTFASDHATNDWARRATRAGDALPLIGFGAVGMLALDGTNPVRQRTAFAAGEAGAAAFVAATGLKYALGRSRPGTSENEHRLYPFSTESGRDSFPSRHAAVAWALATPFAEQYRSFWPYAAVTLTTLGRTLGGEHWLSDTVGGALLGYGLGQLFWRATVQRHKEAPRLVFGTEHVGLLWKLD